MGKCSNCGRKGLFMKTINGLCKDCATKADQLKQIERQLADKDALLLEAKATMRTKAQAELEARHTLLSEKLPGMEEQYADLAQKLDAATKKMQSTERRIQRAADIYKSIEYANMYYVFDDNYKPNYFEDIEEYQSSNLKCMSMKDLRARFRQNQKAIEEVSAEYSAKYRTKANATIYSLMVMAMDAELRTVLQGMSFGKLDKALGLVKDMIAQYYEIAADGNQTIAPTLKKYIGQIEYLYTEAVKIEYEYYVQRERAKEEQRELREQMRQEAEERKRLEQERKQVEKEELKYAQEMKRINEQISEAHAEDPELAKLRKRLAELEKQMQSVENRKAEIVTLQNGKAGTVYIISNIGSFGDNIYKIGMTRRLEPQDRVNELGDASVPFPFDVHSFIFSQDAVSLETELHRRLHDRRVNKVNMRKEFFSVSIDELRNLVDAIDPTAPFTETALAEQYRQSISAESMPEFGTFAQPLDETDDVA